MFRIQSVAFALVTLLAVHAEAQTLLKFDRPFPNGYREADPYYPINIVRSGDLSVTTIATVRDCCGDFAWLTPISVTFGPGETRKFIPFPINDNIYVDFYRPIHWELLQDGVSVDKEWAVVLEDEGPPRFNIGDVWVEEGDDGASEIAFTVTITPADTWPYVLRVSTIDGGTAQPGVDFEPREEFLDFDMRRNRQTFRVPIHADHEFEGDETVRVQFIIMGGYRGVILRNTATGTIVDDDRVTGTLTPVVTTVAPGDPLDLFIDFHEPLRAGATIPLQSSDPSVLSVPASIDVAAGARQTFFTASSHAEGSVQVTATLPSGGATLLSHVTVYALRTPLVTPNTLTLETGAVRELEVRAVPDSGPELPMKITARDGAIVEVPATAKILAGGGVRIPVRAKAAGTTTIDFTFTDQNGSTTSVPVTVTAPPPPPSPPPPPPKKRRATRH